MNQCIVVYDILIHWASSKISVYSVFIYLRMSYKRKLLQAALLPSGAVENKPAAAAQRPVDNRVISPVTTWHCCFIKLAYISFSLLNCLRVSTFSSSTTVTLLMRRCMDSSISCVLERQNPNPTACLALPWFFVMCEYRRSLTQSHRHHGSPYVSVEHKLTATGVFVHCLTSSVCRLRRLPRRLFPAMIPYRTCK